MSNLYLQQLGYPQIGGVGLRSRRKRGIFTEQNQRPYRDTSPWNTLIGPSPHVISTYTDTRGYISNLEYDNGYYNEGASTGKRTNDIESVPNHVLTCDPTSFTFPIYFTDNTVPEYDVWIGGTFREQPSEDASEVINHGNGQVIQIRIPPDAVPPNDDDGQLVIINLDDGQEYSLRCQDFPFALGSCAHFGAHDYDVKSNGSIYNVGWLGVPSHGYPSRGMGAPYLAGTLRPWEIQNGIQHALSFGIDYPCRSFVFPATKSDGGSGNSMTMGYLSSTNADRSVGGALFNKYLTTGTGTPQTSFNVTVAPGATSDGYGWTADGYFSVRGSTTAMVPAKTEITGGTAGSELDGNGVYTLDLEVLAGSSDILLSFKIDKCNSSGTVLTTSAFSLEEALTTGHHNLTVSTSAIGFILGTGTLGTQDRIRVTYRFRSLSSGATITLRSNWPTSMLTPPWGGWLPEGARLQLDPTISEATIRTWTIPVDNDIAAGFRGQPISEAGVQMALALQRYGMIVDDQSGSKKHRVEHTLSANWGTVLARDTARAIPLTSLRWVEPLDPSIAPWYQHDDRVGL